MAGYSGPLDAREVAVAEGAGWDVELKPGKIQVADEQLVDAVKLVDTRLEGSYGIITRSAKEPGRWQFTWLDERGPVGDTQRDTLQEALDHARRWHDMAISEIVSRAQAQQNKSRLMRF